MIDTATLAACCAALTAAAVAAWFFVRVRRLEEELRKTKDSVTQTSRLLIQKNVELFDKSLNQQNELSKKDDFVAIASHQLRTPLNEVIWALGELIDGCKDAELKTAYERIFASAKRMQKIIEDLLSFVQLQEGKLRQTVPAYEPDPIILAAVQRLGADFKDTNVTLTHELEYKSAIDSIDTASLDMVVSNLIENAYHYTPAGGRIHITTRKNNAEDFELVISDTGIGIPREMVADMFKKFRRAPAAVQRNKGGSGLGLYVIKTLLDLSGGSVKVESTEGKGTKFHVHLPKAKNPMAAAVPNSLPPLPPSLSRTH